MIKNINYKNSSGFTLIELLIVIAIIGILASFITANFRGVRQRGRDAQRKSNLHQIRSALEFYRADNDSYPSALRTCPSGSPSYLGSSTCGAAYLNPIPTDPLDGSTYSYTRTSTSQYTLTACLENAQDADQDATNTCAATLRSYTLRNP